MVETGYSSALTRKLTAFISLSNDELRLIAELESNSFVVERGQDITEEGQTGHKAYVLQDGWAQTYKAMPDSRRLRRAAQRAALDFGSLFFSGDRRGGKPRAWHAHAATLE